MSKSPLITIGALLCLLLILIETHVVKQVKTQERQVVSAYVNQERQIQIPFGKCFKVEPQLEANSKFIHFKPTRIGLDPIKTYSLKNEGSNITVLQELRSPITYKHGHLLVFEGYLMAFFAPNAIIIVEQTQTGFKIKNRYYLEQLDRFDQFKMYKLGEKGLLVVNNKRRAYLLNQLDYEDYQFPQTSAIMHLVPLNAQEFYAAEFSKGLVHYKLVPTDKRIEVVRHITGESLGFKGEFSYVVDVNLNFYQSEKIVLALDVYLGLVQIDLSGPEPKGSIIVSHKMCQSFDAIQRDHIVLLCQNQGHSTILEAHSYINRKTKAKEYKKAEPIYQANYLNDLHVAQNYFVVYSYKNIHVFWNTLKNRLPETLQTQSQIVLPGIETFLFQRKDSINELYTIEAGQLNKYRLVEKPASLTLLSQEPIQKDFRLFLYGSCNDLPHLEKKDKVEACKINKNIALRVSQEEYPRQQDFGISASIVAILVIIFLLVIWFCLRKYKGLERQARKVLQNYQNKRARATRKI